MYSPTLINTNMKFYPPDAFHPQMPRFRDLKINIYHFIKQAYRDAGNKWLQSPRSMYSDLIRYELCFDGKYENNRERFIQVMKALWFLDVNNYPYDIDCSKDSIRSTSDIYNKEHDLHDVFLFFNFVMQCGKIYEEFYKWFIKRHDLKHKFVNDQKVSKYLLDVLFTSKICVPKSFYTSKNFEPNPLKYILRLLTINKNGYNRVFEDRIYQHIFMVTRGECEFFNGQYFEYDNLQIFLEAAIYNGYYLFPKYLEALNKVFLYGTQSMESFCVLGKWVEPFAIEMIEELKGVTSPIDELTEQELKIMRKWMNNLVKECDQYDKIKAMETFYGYYQGKVSLEHIEMACTFRFNLEVRGRNRYIYEALKPRNFWNWQAWEEQLKPFIKKELQGFIDEYPVYEISCALNQTIDIIAEYL